MQRNAESRDCATELQKYVSEEREWKGRRGGRGEREGRGRGDRGKEHSGEWRKEATNAGLEDSGCV